MWLQVPSQASKRVDSRLISALRYTANTLPRHGWCRERVESSPGLPFLFVATTPHHSTAQKTSKQQQQQQAAAADLQHIIHGSGICMASTSMAGCYPHTYIHPLTAAASTSTHLWRGPKPKPVITEYVPASINLARRRWDKKEQKEETSCYPFIY